MRAVLSIPVKFYKDAKDIVVAQAIATVILLPLGFMIGGKLIALSLFAGALVCLLPALYLFNRAFRVFGASKAQKIMTGFYAGQAGKFVLTTILFALVFQLDFLNVTCIFMGFIGVQLIHGLVPLVAALKKKEATKQRVAMS